MMMMMMDDDDEVRDEGSGKTQDNNQASWSSVLLRTDSNPWTQTHGPRTHGLEPTDSNPRVIGKKQTS